MDQVDRMTLVNQGKGEDFRMDGFGILRFRDRVCVPDVPELKRRSIEECHRSALIIHLEQRRGVTI